jgi:LPS sulfotransferase NodH
VTTLRPQDSQIPENCAEAATHIHTSYLVCATPRSGSSLLCEVLTNSGLAGRPEEYFWKSFEAEWSERWDASDYGEYLECALHEGTTANGVFGAKIMWAHLEYFTHQLRCLRGNDVSTVPDLLSSLFPGLHYIYISRQDTVRQAVSLWRALQTWEWNKTDQSDSDRPEAVFDFAAIDHLVQEIDAHNAGWKQFFQEHGIEPYTLVYEELTLDPERHARDILLALGIPVPEHVVFAPRRLRRQADALSEEWLRHYGTLKESQGNVKPVLANETALLLQDAFLR